MNPFTLNIEGRLIKIDKPIVMGIVNVTPDSFYADSRTQTADDIRRQVDKHIQEGATIIDLGGYSSRPGADEVSVDEEYRRLARGLEVIRKDYPSVIVSIDTFRADVARKCVKEWNANIINDISGGDLDREMWDIIAELKVPYILMHMRGTPQTMQSDCLYEDVTADVLFDLSKKISQLHQLGINDIIVDPGFGFAKNLDQNYQLMAELTALQSLNKPILVGISHKSMIYKLLQTTPQESLNGTTILNTIALLNGAAILRVHDVKEAVEAIEIVDKIKTSSCIKT